MPLIQLVGPPFSGKSTSACTFPKPMTYLDFDGSARFAKYVKDKNGKLVVPDFDQIGLVEMIQAQVQPLEFKSATDADFKSGQAPKYVAGATKILSAYNKEIETISNLSDDQLPKTLVLDSGSTIFRLWDEAIMSVNRIPAIRIGDYKTLNGILFGQFLPTLRHLATKIKWVILINHEIVDKNELTGMVTEAPVATSATTSRLLSKEFDCVWRQAVENSEYLWKTKPSGLFKGAGTRGLNLPDIVKPATFQTLRELLPEELR